MDGITGHGIAAPGVEFYNNRFWLLIQQEFSRPNGNIYTYSSTNGYNFTYEEIALKSIPDSVEAGIYDAAVKTVSGDLYLMYSGFPYPYKDMNNTAYAGIHGDIYLAKCGNVDNTQSEWTRIGSIIKHEDIPFHNGHTAKNREWGLEGCDFIKLEDKSILLTGVCFLKNGRRGHRQRIFVVHAASITSNFKVIGILSNPINDSGATENGHPCMAKVGQDVMIFIQFYKDKRWQIGSLVINETELLKHF